MKPLLTNQKMLTLLCICPADETKRKWIKCMYITFSCVVITMEMCALCSSALFFRKNVSIDLDAALFALFQIFAMLETIYTYIVALVIRYKICDTIETLTSIYDKSKTFRPIFHSFKSEIILIEYFHSKNFRCQKRFVPISRSGQQ